MSTRTLRKLENYKKRQGLSDRNLSGKLGVYPVYIYRWRKAGRIIGAYERIVEEFLKKEEQNGKV